MFADGTVKDGDYSYTQMLGTYSVASEIYGKIVQKMLKLEVCGTSKLMTADSGR